MTRRAARVQEAWGDHAADGSDAAGEGLPVTIRIGPDGRVYFQDITEGLVEVALAVHPEDASMRERLRIMREFRHKETT